MTRLPCTVVLVLLLISRRQLTPSSGKRSARHVSDDKAASPWLRVQTVPRLEPKQVHKRHCRHSREQAVAGPTAHITSRDSTPTCTQTEQLLFSRKHENTALRENYMHDVAFTKIKELVGLTVAVLLKTVVHAVAHLWPPGTPKTLRRTFRASTEWTFTMQSTPLQSSVLVGLTVVADFNTLTLNVYITSKCLPVLISRIPLDVFLKILILTEIKCCERPQVLSEGLMSNCTVCRGITPLVLPSLPRR